MPGLDRWRAATTSFFRDGPGRYCWTVKARNMTRADNNWFESYLADKMQAAFRKWSEHSCSAFTIHRLIRDMDEDEWSGIVLCRTPYLRGWRIEGCLSRNLS